MERDEDVLEMYDQPTRIQLHYHARSGRKTSPWHTPDFLVLRQQGAVFEEWKHAASLMRWDQVLLYGSLAEIPPAPSRAAEAPAPFTSHFLFDGRLWEASIEATTVILQPEIGPAFRLPLEHFQRLIASGEMKEVTPSTPSPLQESVREIVSLNGPKALEAANRRLRTILAWKCGEAITVTTRSMDVAILGCSTRLRNVAIAMCASQMPPGRC